MGETRVERVKLLCYFYRTLSINFEIKIIYFWWQNLKTSSVLNPYLTLAEHQRNFEQGGDLVAQEVG